MKASWANLTTTEMVESERHQGDKVSKKERYFISSLPHYIQTFAPVVRGHWGVENWLNWCLDVYYEKDKSRVRKGRSAQNLAGIGHPCRPIIYGSQNQQL